MSENPQPVPQWANPFLGNEQKLAELELRFNPVWLKWFLDLVQDLVTSHEDLGGLQGGVVGQRFHLTAAQAGQLSGGQTANTVLAGPAAGAAAVATFRALVAADLAGISTVTGVYPVDGAVAGTVSSITINNGLITAITTR